MEKALLSFCCGDGSSTLVSLWMQKALPQNSHVRNVQNRKHVVKKKKSLKADTTAPGPFPKCPADLPNSKGLRLRVRMK